MSDEKKVDDTKEEIFDEEIERHIDMIASRIGFKTINRDGLREMLIKAKKAKEMDDEKTKP